MTTTARAIINNSRNTDGKIDVRLAIRNLVAQRHSEMEAAEHLIAFGCPTDLAYGRAFEAISGR
jgi:hypothetical protein